MCWLSHALIGARLQQAANNEITKLALAGAISQNEHHCWEWWIKQTDTDTWRATRNWALELMRTWVKAGDNAPDELSRLID